CLQGAAHLDPRVMLRWIAVLDGVRDEVGEAQLDRGRGDFHVREIVTEPQCYALRCRHLAQLASNFRCCARQPHVPVLSRVGANHRELEQIVEDSLHTADITDNYRRELATLLVLEIRDLENLPGPKTCTDAISKFMCERAIERSEAFFTLCNPVRHQLQELRRGSLLDQRHRVEDALRACHELFARALD